MGTATCACVGTAATLYCMLCAVLYTNMPCTADTTTWLGTAIALYTTDTATCMGTAIALYYVYMLCTADTTTCLDIAIALLYFICYALRIPPHA